MARRPIQQDIEATPEADRLGEAPHPRHTRVLHGHDEPAANFKASIDGGRAHHGWLITGREGIGKATFAYSAARYLLAAPAERLSDATFPLAITETGRSARQVAALSHPGLLLLRRAYDTKTKRFTASIPTDEVRRTKGFLAHTAGDGGHRVVLVDTADDLNVNAANALLKSLEEPPVSTTFLLVSSEPGKLLPTIRSRCRVLALSPLSEENLEHAVNQAALAMDGANPPSKADWPALHALARGSVRSALMALEGEGVKLVGRVQAMLAKLPDVDWSALHQTGDELSGTAAEAQFNAYFDILLDQLHAMIKARASGHGSGAARVIKDGTLAHWAEAHSAIARARDETLSLNLDRKALILATAERLATLVRGGGR